MTRTLARAARPALCLLTLSLIALPCATTARAGEVWVDAVNGDDANGGTGPGDAWRTITHALAQLGPVAGAEVDLVHVLPGDYDAGHGETFPLELRDRVRLVGEAGPAATRLWAVIHPVLSVGVGGDPTGPETGAEGLSLLGASEGIVVSTPKPERPRRAATFRDLVIQDCDTGLRVRAGGAKSAGSAVVLEDCVLRSCYWPFDVVCRQGTSLAVTLRGSSVEDCGGALFDARTEAFLELTAERSRLRLLEAYLHGVRVTTVAGGGRARVVLRDTEVTSFCLSTTALYLEAEALVERCTISGHDQGLVLALRVPSVLRDSILYGNYEDLRTPQGWTVTVEGCDIDDPQYAGKDGNFAAEPLFVDPRGNDYRLRWGSPCVDRAPASRTPDVSGRPRDVDGDLDGLAGADVGARELVTLDGPAAAALGSPLALAVHGPADGTALIQLSRRAPLDAPLVTGQGLLWLEPGTFGTVAIAPTGGGLPRRVVLDAPADPALAGATVGYQALVRSPAAAGGAAWSSAVAVRLE